MTPSGEGTRDRSTIPASRADREDAQLAQIVARRAIRRLDMLEWVIFAVGAGLAAGGGALIAWMLSTLVGWDFRSTWIGASLLLFVVPGAISIAQIRRDERAASSATGGQQEGDDG